MNFHLDNYQLKKECSDLDFLPPNWDLKPITSNEDIKTFYVREKGWLGNVSEVIKKPC